MRVNPFVIRAFDGTFIDRDGAYTTNYMKAQCYATREEAEADIVDSDERAVAMRDVLSEVQS